MADEKPKATRQKHSAQEKAQTHLDQVTGQRDRLKARLDKAEAELAAVKPAYELAVKTVEYAASHPALAQNQAVAEDGAESGAESDAAPEGDMSTPTVSQATETPAEPVVQEESVADPEGTNAPKTGKGSKVKAVDPFENM